MAQIRILLYQNGPDPRSGSGFKVFGVWVLLEYCRIRVQGLCVIVCVYERGCLTGWPVVVEGKSGEATIVHKGHFIAAFNHHDCVFN